MKNKIIISGISILLMTLIMLVSVAKVGKIKETSLKADTEKSEVYILGSNNGNLSVFDENKNLICEYDFNINSLPDKDIEILTKGLTLYGFDSLRSAIEDYTS